MAVPEGSQVCAAHCVAFDQNWQAGLATLPLHSPVKPQVLDAAPVHSACGSEPTGIGWHSPFGLVVRMLAHASHVPLQSSLQQTPSTQKFDLHCAEVSQE